MATQMITRHHLDASQKRLTDALAAFRDKADAYVPARIAENPVVWVVGAIAAGLALAWFTRRMVR